MENNSSKQIRNGKFTYPAIHVIDGIICCSRIYESNKTIAFSFSTMIINNLQAKWVNKLVRYPSLAINQCVKQQVKKPTYN